MRGRGESERKEEKERGKETGGRGRGQKGRVLKKGGREGRDEVEGGSKDVKFRGQGSKVPVLTALFSFAPPLSVAGQGLSSRSAVCDVSSLSPHVTCTALFFLLSLGALAALLFFLVGALCCSPQAFSLAAFSSRSPLLFRPLQVGSLLSPGRGQGPGFLFPERASIPHVWLDFSFPVLLFPFPVRIVSRLMPISAGFPVLLHGRSLKRPFFCGSFFPHAQWSRGSGSFIPVLSFMQIPRGHFTCIGHLHLLHQPCAAREPAMRFL